MRFGLLFALALSVLAVVFAFMNNEDVIVDFGFFETQGPLALVLILTFVIGVIVGILGMLPGRLRKQQELRTLRKHQTEASPTTPPVVPKGTEPGA